MKKNRGYILLESVLSLALLAGLVFSYLTLTVQLQKQTEEKIARMDDYRTLYLETRRKRLYPEAAVASEVALSFDAPAYAELKGGKLTIAEK